MIEQSCVLDVEHRTTFHRHVAHQAGPLCGHLEFLVKRFVGLRVLYIYSFAFDLVELGECTRIRGYGPVSTGCLSGLKPVCVSAFTCPSVFIFDV